MSYSYREMEEQMKKFDEEELTYQEHKEAREKTNNYKKECKGISFDVYDILKAYDVKNPAIQHAIKKLLAGGKRGYKDVIQDYEEAIVSIKRGVELEDE